MKAMIYTAPVLDSVLTIDAVYPLEDNRTYGIVDEKHSIGGPCTTVVGAKRMGVDIFPVGTIGRDAAGDACCKQFASEGIRTDGLEVREGYKTREVFGIVDARHKHSYIYNTRLAICPLDFCEKFIEEVQLAGFSGYTMTLEEGNEENPWNTIAVMRRCHEKGVITILDPGSMMDNMPPELLTEACRLMDYIMLNMEEAQYLSGIPEGDAVTCGVKIAETYGGTAIVKDGGRGAAWCTAEGGVMYPAFKVEVVNTNGAGDTFQAGFIYALLAGKSPDEIMRYATATAALKVAVGGAAADTPTLAQVEDFLAQRS